MKIINDEVVQSVVEVLNKEKLFRYDCKDASQSEVALLENELAQRVGSQYAVAMNSCSSALYVSLLCAGIKPGDKVALPAFTFIAVPSAIVHAGAQPVLIEIDQSYVMDLNDFEQKIANGDIKVLMLSYMRGRVPDLDKVITLCQQYGVILLEDAAHSLGVCWKGKQTGTLGLAGAYSAQSYKMVDGGEGGFLVTNDKEFAFKAMLYAGCYEYNWKKHFGTTHDVSFLKKLTSSIPAYNFRMSNLSAAVIRPQIKYIDERVDYLNANYLRLKKILSTNDFIRIPEFVDGVRPAPDSIQWEFVGLSDECIDRIIADLAQKKVQLEIFKGSNARNFWNWTFFDCHEDCFYTKQLIQRTIDLRLRFHLSSSDIDIIGREIVNSVGNFSKEWK